MYQQVNFYRSEFLKRKERFGSAPLIGISVVLVVAMIGAYIYATYEMMGLKNRLKVVNGQEQAAIERLENFRPDTGGPDGQESWSQKLEAAKRALQDQELVLTMVVDSSLGNIDGFSRHLTSLARQNTEGLWLSYVRLTALGDNTQLDGEALRPDLVPRYLQSLALEDPFAEQRFTQFNIDRPVADEGGAKQVIGNTVKFSVRSESQMIANAGDGQ